MIINPGVIVTVRHYSLLNIFKSAVSDASDSEVSLKVSKEFSIVNFLIGDPIVIAFVENEKVNIIGGRLVKISPVDELLVMKIDVLEAEAKDRLYERFPASHYAGIRIVDTGKKCSALVKDVSNYGLYIFCSEDLYKGQVLDIDIFLTRDILSLKAEVVRKNEGITTFEYGMKIVHNGPIVFNRIKDFIRKTHDEHINRFNKE
jgi:hypothetical protein